MKLSREFYNIDSLTLAEKLIGKILVRKTDNEIIKGRITETEAYIGAIDKASHCYGGKKTERTKIMFGPPGFAYVYLIYGMYYCLNIVADKEEVCSAVLLRSIDPIENIEKMCLNRYNKNISEISKYQMKNLCNGPGKLCKALNITKSDNGVDLLGNELYVEDDGFRHFSIETSKRINIDYAEEAKDFLWRFTINYI